MMKKIILSIAIALASTSVFAQSSMVEKLQKVEGVEYVSMSKDVIKSLISGGKGMSLGDINLFQGNVSNDAKEVFEKVDHVQLATSDDEKAVAKINKTTEKLIKSCKAKELVNLNQEGVTIKVYSMKKGGSIISINVKEENRVVLFYIEGTFTMEEFLKDFNFQTQE